MKKNTNMVSLVVIGAGIIVAIATGMQSRNANAIPEGSQMEAHRVWMDR